MDYYCYHLHLCTSLRLWTVLFCICGLYYYYFVAFCHCTVIQLFVYFYSRKCAK